MKNSAAARLLKEMLMVAVLKMLIDDYYDEVFAPCAPRAAMQKYL